jgi:ABC-type uncharacterized transport system permease subunit
VVRAGVGVLALGALVHGASFAWLHAGPSPPPLTDLSAAVSFMSWIGVVFYLLLLLRARLADLVILVAPIAFLGVFVSALHLHDPSPATFVGSGSWPHAHVLLASAGIALLGLAGLAGLLYLAEHRRLKAKRAARMRLPLPSLEALDRVNAASLAVGFPLLTLGVLTGMMWVQVATGAFFSGAAHELWSVVAWAVYAVLVAGRFVTNQGARQAAASAVLGFAFLFFAVIGLELFT